ncbi:basic phospholipase A2 Vb-2 [Lingula anatina]|uniref:Phospholipase A2 n=1 Tax=Lingula anatina TaxID=7574 RepID=A0A1S3I7C0_LINAN|nr:basic phospholipase A2 Vb-2 [Lingula anatina]|eukprot:XP_013394098.1 basic phospholipase A2 Vb-2 [Lingula anatina]
MLSDQVLMAVILVILGLCHVALGAVVHMKQGLKIPTDTNHHRLGNLLQLGNLISCYTGRSELDYIYYGCYCGPGGKGIPVDAADACCQVHDNCYGQVKATGTCPFDTDPYFRTYRYTGCGSRAPAQCVPASSYIFSGTCRAAICQCDLALAQCLGGSPFNKQYEFYDKSSC